MDPQNPYCSAMIEASAGSGKTYQLSKRFLFLVGAGSDPSAILTITFTNKAALEMRERIIQEASRLLYCKKTAIDFDKKLCDFYLSKQKNIDFVLKKPLSSQQTAKYILSSTQSLKVATIDSVFYEWMMRFPLLNLKEDMFASNCQIATDSSAIKELSESSWNQLFLKEQDRIVKDLLTIKNTKFGGSIFDIKSRIEELFRHVTFIEHLQQQGKKTTSKFAIKALEQNIKNIIAVDLKDELLTLAGQSKNKEQLIIAIDEGCLQSLQESKLITRSLRVSAQTIRGKKRETFSDAISNIDSTLQMWDANQKKITFNLLGESLAKIYHKWYQCRENIKNDQRIIEFEDLSKIAAKIFCESDHYGIQWLIKKNINHLMIDEFQDTSLVQWDVFEKLSEEIISAYGEEKFIGTIGTVFFVGDKKQSIYGFREADPRVMDYSREMLIKRDCFVVPMNSSYRSNKIILKFLNKVFKDIIGDEFPEHKAAITDSNGVFSANAKVVVRDLFLAVEEDTLSPIEKEACFVAQYLKAAIGSNSYSVYDKSTKSVRPLQARDCCILYRSSTHVSVFEKYLQENNIAYSRAENNGFFKRPEIQIIISLFKFIANPHDIFSLAVIYRSPLADINEELFVKIFIELQSIDKTKKSTYILDKLVTLGSSLAKELKFIIESVYRLSLKDLITCIYEKIPIYNKLINSSYGNKEFIKANIERYQELVYSIEQKGCVSIVHFVEELLHYEKNDSIGCVKDNSDSVQLMTIHKAKGLEFPCVCVIDTESFWYKFDRYWVKEDKGLRYLDTKKNTPINDDDFNNFLYKYEQNFLAESIRLLYVAFTRASQYLVVTGNSKKETSNNFHSKIVKTIATDNDFKYKNNKYELSNIAKNLFNDVKEISNKDSTYFNTNNYSWKNKIPYEIDIISPHELLLKNTNKTYSQWYGLDLSNNLKANIGTFIHQIFARYFDSLPIDLDKLWNNFFVLSKFSKAELFMLSKVKTAIYQEIECSIKSNFFVNIKRENIEIKSEKGIVFFDSTGITRGYIDLYVKFPLDYIKIIDYKCTEPKTSNNLYDHCIAMGYNKQLEAYVKAVKNIENPSHIEGGVWLSKKAKYIKLFEF